MLRNGGVDCPGGSGGGGNGGSGDGGAAVSTVLMIPILHYRSSKN